MSIELVREQRIGFGANGVKVAVDEYYIKLKVGFEAILFELHDSSRCFFLEVALHEAKIELLGAAPLTLSEVADITHLSRRACVYAASDLQARNLIVKVGTREDGSHMYRPCDYAWFGADRVPPPAPSNTGSMQNLHTPPKVPKRVLKAQQRVQRAAQGMQPVAHPPMQNGAKGMQKRAPLHDDDVLIQKDISSETPSIMEHAAPEAETRAEIETILAEAFDGVNVQRLAKRLDSPALAQAWVDWCKDVDTLKRYRNPQGAAYREIMATRNARPKVFGKREAEKPRRKPTITGKLAAHALNRSKSEK